MIETLSSSEVTTIGIWLNGIIAAIAVAGFIVSLVFSVISLNKLKEQIGLQNRPILKLDVNHTMKPKRIVEIKNIGTGPALNITYVSSMIKVNSEITDGASLNSLDIGLLGSNETYQIEFEDDFGIQAVFLQYAQEKTNMEHLIYTPLYYEDVFGVKYISGTKIKMRYDSNLVYETESPRLLTKKEIKKLNKISLDANAEKKEYV